MSERRAPEGTITEAELAEALATRLRNVGGTHLILTDPAASAADIFAEALAHREPEYKPGATYRDAKGEDWRYEPGASADKPGSWAECPWLRMGSAGVFSVGTPDRPLRKLVPLPSHDELVAVLVESITHDVHGYEGQAQRVLKLLEGGTDD